MTTATSATPTDAANPSNGAQSITQPTGMEATAAALYGNQQKASSDQTQPAAKPAQPAESKGASETANAEAAQPQAAYELKAPEGRAFDPEVIGSFSEVARELNLSQEAAQTVLDRIAPKMAERQAAMLEAIRSEWTEASRSDKEFGGDRLPENLSVARKALESFGTPELRTLLNESGLGNHPELIRFMVRAGKAISEDRYVGQSQSTPPKGDQPRDFNSMAAGLYS